MNREINVQKMTAKHSFFISMRVSINAWDGSGFNVVVHEIPDLVAV